MTPIKLPPRPFIKMPITFNKDLADVVRKHHDKVVEKMMFMPPIFDPRTSPYANRAFRHPTNLTSADQVPNPICDVCSRDGEDKPVREMGSWERDGEWCFLIKCHGEEETFSVPFAVLAEAEDFKVGRAFTRKRIEG